MSLRSGFQQAADICTDITGMSIIASTAVAVGGTIGITAQFLGYALSGSSPVGSAIGGLVGCVATVALANIVSGDCVKSGVSKKTGAVAVAGMPIGAVAGAVTGFHLMPLFS